MREQELVLRTLESDAADPDDAKRALVELEDQVKQHTPAVEAARGHCEEAKQRRAAAWNALTQSSERAEKAFAAETRAGIAAGEAKAAAERRDLTAATLEQARTAAKELEALEPAIARAAELRARHGEHEQRQQTHERATKLRERRHAAQARQVTLTEQITTLARGSEQSDQIAAQINEAEQALQTLTARLLALADEIPLATARARTGRQHETATVEIAALSAQLTQLKSLREEQKRIIPELARHEAEDAEIKRTLAEEQHHREEIERDGPAARCLRCKRPYGSDFTTIIHEYETTIVTLSDRREALAAKVAAAHTRQDTLTKAIAELAPLETRRATLEAQLNDEPAAPDASTLERQAQALIDEQTGIRAQHDQQEALLGELRRRRDALAASEAQRRQLEEAAREALAEAELFSRELAELPANGYDPEAHEAIRTELATALAAEERAHVLRPNAAEVALLEQRLASEHALAQASAAQAHALSESAAASAADRDALKAAQELLERADQALARCAEELQRAEEQALRDSAEVQAAREALKKRARKQGQRLKKERLELRYRGAAATILKDYNADAQRRAFPTVARETSELLASLTHGRYSDARLDESGALELFDEGAHHPLRRFSGGEQDLANLCLRIALSRALARQRGLEAGFIILDEVFGSQDLERRSALIEQLKELRRDFRQVFVVSHFDDVVDECDLQIEVTRTDGISTATPLNA